MRVSVTECCNLKCNYCMPQNFKTVSENNMLSFDDIVKICDVSSELGISKIKITGGEPLVRKNVTQLVKRIKAETGIKSVTMTTNGVLIEELFDEICACGLDGVNISLDTLEGLTYNKITGYNNIDKVLGGIDKLYNAGIPVKINTVLQKGLNDGDWIDMLSLAKERSIDIRFIEMMPIGEGRCFEPVLNSDIIKKIGSKLKRLDIGGNGPAEYYALDGYKGRIGFISSVSNKFCKCCNRIRLTSTGYLKSCLCYDIGLSLKEVLESGDREKLKCAIKIGIENKPEGHCFGDINKVTEKKEMNKIGG